MDDSILISIKKLLGIEKDDKSFDTDIIIHINSAIMNLSQIGVGSSSGFAISDENDTWSDFTLDANNTEAVKSYVYIKVKLMFDPPSSSAVIDALERQAKELEWRINTSVDPGKTYSEANIV